MSDMQYPSPPLPPSQPQQKDNKIQILAASFFALAIAILVAVIAIPSSNSDSDSGNNDATMIQVPDVTAAPVNKYDSYYEHVLNNSGQANTLSKADVIKIGDLVCQALDEGNSIADIVTVVERAASTTSDAEYGAAVIFGAVTYLCPEYNAMMQSWLRN